MNFGKAFLATVLLVAATFGTGCGDSDTPGVTGQFSPLTPPAPVAAKNGFSEIEWQTDPRLRIQPRHVAALYLEPYDGVPNPDRPDSGGNDHDLIPLAMPQTATVTYSLDPADTTHSIESATLLDSTGAIVFTLDEQRPTISKLLAAGNYVLRVDSGFSVQENNEDHRLVFLFSPPTEAVSGQGIPLDTRAQNQADIARLLSTNACPGGDLAGVNLTGADLDGANLDGANLINAELARSDLNEANLTNANLTEAYLISADLGYASLTGANLSYASLAGASLLYANLTDAHLDYADLTGANLFSANLSKASLIQAGLTANLINATLTGANLANAELANAQLYGVDLTGADLTGADLDGAKLDGASLTGATMPNGQTYNGPDPCPPGYVPTQS